MQMKSYLSLIPISAKVHRRQNRMTLLCIVFAVFLVTSVFSMAEMGVRMEQKRLAERHGSLSFQDVMDSAMGQSLFLAAAALFVLILIAGVLMISGSINSNVAQRTRFFGMMRCIGMSRAQIIRFVRLEALNWCRTAVPAGVALGIVTTWILCAVLRFLVGEEFSQIPLFGISLIGIISGIVMGIAAVLIAARAPAKRASKVSPVTAASGNPENPGGRERGMSSRMIRIPRENKGGFQIETALGIHHAVSAKKNLVLMTGSFALSILLFLSFSVLIDFVDCLMPQSAAASDIDISSSDGTNTIGRGLLDTIRGMDGVKQVYGRRNMADVPADRGTLDLVSYDEFDLDCLKKDGALKWGSDITKVYGDSRYVLATWDPESTWKIGDRIRTGGEELEIAGLLKNDPFSRDGLTGGKMTLITSGETFTRLTGVKDYSLVMIQINTDAQEEDVQAIRSAVGENYVFHDRRDQSTTGTYTAFVFCVYGFLVIITLVTVLNIINSVSMSVSARIRQYGAMRAVGMEERQIRKMIAAEAFTYAVLGCAAGCAAGLLLSKALYDTLITAHFKYAVWSLPVGEMVIILAVVGFAAAAAAYAPAKRMREISVTETINEL